MSNGKLAKTKKAGLELDERLTNDDLAPVPESERTWNRWHIAALWVGMAVSIPTYTLASGLVAQGWSFGMAVTAVALGNVIVLIPMVLNAHAGTKYGIPFPVLLRAPFGVIGANIPAMMRAIVACGWFGIQTWIGGTAIYALTVALLPGSWSLPDLMPGFMGINTGQFLSFVVFWIINVAIIVRGIETIRVFETWAAPFLLVIGVALFMWAWTKSGDLGVMLSSPDGATGWNFDGLAIGLTVGVSFWGTLALNIPDFSRYAKSQKDQIVGQAVGLPGSMTMFAFVGAAVTNATAVIYGSTISDPVVLLERIGGPVLTILAMFGLAVATLTTNLAANVVSPANDFSNLSPSRISFKTGAYITAIIGFVIMPWKLYMDAAAYLFTWLLGYGAMLGAIGGIMIVDYFLLRGMTLKVYDLYRRTGDYEYKRGFNLIALAALFIGIAPNVPGLVGALAGFDPGSLFVSIYKWAWFVSFFVAGGVYYIGMRVFAADTLPEASEPAA